MSTQAKYGWSIGLIVMGVVLALPFRHSPIDDRQVVASEDSSFRKNAVPRQGPLDDDPVNQNASSGAKKLGDSQLLPDSGQPPHQAAPQQNQPKQNQPSSGPIVGQVPNRFESPTATPPKVIDTEVIDMRPPEHLQPVEFSNERVIRKMPSTVGPYRMKPVRSNRFVRASQTNRDANVSGPMTRQKVIHYKLRDGDSLRSIARRYLGNESRYQDILLDNRHILTNGESFLPVGQLITIVLPE
ncbi:MAG: LysM domain-containing protein [Planctomycetota bacterium]|nr:LysM domain-containing protein [Planctomycetota bacterium]